MSITYVNWMRDGVGCAHFVKKYQNKFTRADAIADLSEFTSTKMDSFHFWALGGSFLIFWALSGKGLMVIWKS